MITLTLSGPAEFYLSGSTDDIRPWRDSHGHLMPGSHFHPKVQSGDWDGVLKPGEVEYDVSTHTYHLKLPYGWLPVVIQDLAPKLIIRYSDDLKPMRLLDLGRIPKETWDMLRDYQQEALQLISKERWGRIEFATNAGKGAVIALAALAAVDQKVLILVDEVAVFQALEAELEKWLGTPPGIVKAGHKDIPEESIVLAMVPTLAKRLQRKKGTKVLREKWESWLASFSMALLDEADRATAKGWQTVCRALTNTYYRVGFSGSFPASGTFEDWQLQGVLGSSLSRVRNSELVRRGISALPTIEIHRYLSSNAHEMLGEGEPSPRNYVYEKCIIYEENRHRFLLSLLPDDGTVAIVVNRLDHGEALQELIPDSRFIHGDFSDKERVGVLEAFASGEFRILITTKILDRGSNMLGHVRSIILAAGEGSHRQVLQRIGRGLRRGSGKERIRLIDVFDFGHRYLTSAASRRMAVYHEEGFEIVVH